MNESKCISNIVSFRTLYEAICGRDSEYVFLKTTQGDYTYGDLIECVENTHSNVNKHPILEFIAKMFRTRLDGKAWVLSDYTPTEKDLSLGPDIIISTSGTRLQKHVMHKEERLFRDLQQGIPVVGLRPDDVSMCLLPFDHIFGLQCGLLAQLMIGCVIAIPSSSLSTFEDIVRVRPTFIVCLPQLADFIPDNSGIRTILMGGTSIPKGGVSGPRDAELYFGYGSTECLCVSVGPYDGESCGTVLDGYEVEEVSGEIRISGNVMIGYTSGDPLNGPFCTNDLGWIEDGKLFITGRKDGVIVFDDGYKVNTDELIDMLYEVPSITSGRMERFGDDIRLVVTCMDDSNLKGIVERMDEMIRPHKVSIVEVKLVGHKD